MSGSSPTEETATERLASEPLQPQPKRYRTDVLMMLGTKSWVMFLNLASSVLIARALGPDGRGLVAVAFNVTMLLVQFGVVGLTTANPYFAARFAELRPRIVANSLWLAAGLGVLLVGLGYAFTFLVPALVQGLELADLTIVLLAIPFALTTLLLQSILFGEGRTVAYNGFEAALATAVLVALAVGLFVFGMGVRGALLLTLLGHIAGALLWFALLRRHEPRIGTFDWSLARRMLAYGFRIYIASLVAFLIVRFDLLLVNAYLGEREAGIYSVAVALATAIYTIPVVISLNLFPRIARGAGPATTSQVFRVISLAYGVCCLISAPLAGPAIHVLFGAQFEDAVALYLWLLPGIWAYGMLNILSHHFAGIGYPWQAMAIFFPGLVINLGLNIALLEQYGTIVASISSSIAYAFLLVLHMTLFVARSEERYRDLVPRPVEAWWVLRSALRRSVPDQT